MKSSSCCRRVEDNARIRDTAAESAAEEADWANGIDETAVDAVTVAVSVAVAAPDARSVAIHVLASVGAYVVVLVSKVK